MRADLRRDSMVNRKKERATGRKISTGYLENADSDEDGVSLAQIKNKYKKGTGNKGTGNNICFESLNKLPTLAYNLGIVIAIPYLYIAFLMSHIFL